MRPKISIVIAVWDGLDHVVRCVESLYKNTLVETESEKDHRIKMMLEHPGDVPIPEFKFELILVDNASTDGAGEYCDHVARRYPNVKVIHNTENRKFGPAQNQGMEVAEGEFICSLNSDVVVTPYWAEKLLDCLNAEYPWPVAFVGPVSNMSAGRQIVPKGYSSLNDLPAYADKWYREHRGQYFEVGTLFGWCVLGRKETWDFYAAQNEPGKYQPFDERFQNAFEDNDLCLRANLNGEKLMVAGDTYLHHVGQGTILTHFNFDEYQKNGAEERQKFIAKWRDNRPRKLVAVMRIANCERTIQQVLNNTAKFANAGIIVHLCRSKDRTEEIVRAHKAVRRVEVYDGPFQEDYERGKLLEWALELHEQGEADWCISVDGDEIYDHRMLERVQAFMNPAWPHTFAYWCNWRTIWNKDPDGTEWYRADDTFGCFKNYRFFRLMKGQKILSNHPEGHHCGSAPIFPVENLKWANVRVKHLGYETPEQRFKKYDFYTRNDNFKTKRDIGHEDYHHLIDRSVALRRWREKNEISVVCLTGNEGPWFTGFLEHLEPIADEFVIIDTGTEDGTWEYVERWKAESKVPVKHITIPWQDNYSLMRNLAKDHATKEWVLMLDPDERFEPTDVQRILDMIDDEVDCWMFHCLNYLEKADGTGRTPKYVSSDSIRLFRNRPEFYYTGIVHETLEDAVAARRHREPCIVAESPVVIHHHGYLKDPAKVKAKMEYYTKLNEIQIEVTDGKDARPFFNLAMHYMEKDDFNKAMLYLETAKKLGPTSWRVRTTLVGLMMVRAKMELFDVLRMTKPGERIHEKTKEALMLIDKQPFLHAKAVS